MSLRQHFDLDICIRPCHTYKGNPLNFIRRGMNNTIEEPLVDVVIFRQNTEGLYSGVEWTDPPDLVYNALTHSSGIPEEFRKGAKRGYLGLHPHIHPAGYGKDTQGRIHPCPGKSITVPSRYVKSRM